MSLAQQNFTTACAAAQDTLYKLRQHTLSPLHRITLDELSVDELRTMTWHLEAIASAINHAVHDKTTEGPVDLG